MTAMNVTFLGNDAKDKELTWGPDITLPLNKPVLIDPEAGTAEQQKLAEHLIRKGKNLPFLKIEEAKGKAKPAKPAEPAEDDYPEEEMAAEIPHDWRSMHHTALIGLANRLGGDGDIATKDAAIEYIEDYLKAHGTEGATGD